MQQARFDTYHRKSNTRGVYRMEEYHCIVSCGFATRSDRAAMDEAKFEAFYRRQAGGVWSYIYRMTGDPALADDLMQKAHGVCPYSKATRGNVEVTLIAKV